MNFFLSLNLCCVLYLSLVTCFLQWMGGEFLPLGFGLDGAVHALAVTLPYVYAGGSFSRAFTPRRSALQSGSFAKWNTLTREWSSALLCKPSSPSPFSGTVNALATHAGKVLVGGRFGDFLTFTFFVVALCLLFVQVRFAVPPSAISQRYPVMDPSLQSELESVEATFLPSLAPATKCEPCFSTLLFTLLYHS